MASLVRSALIRLPSSVSRRRRETAQDEEARHEGLTLTPWMGGAWVGEVATLAVLA